MTVGRPFGPSLRQRLGHQRIRHTLWMILARQGTPRAFSQLGRYGEGRDHPAHRQVRRSIEREVLP